MEDSPTFSSLQEEVTYWKTKALDLSQGKEQLQKEFDEFTEESKELEAELELQLDQAESSLSDLSKSKQTLELDNERLKERLQATTNEFSFTVSSLQDEVSEYSSKMTDLQKYVRELEHNNDNLERANRAMMCSLEDFEKKLNEAIERNALLENEVEDKAQLQCMVQRLKDESRDLHSELSLIRRKSFNKRPSDLDVKQNVSNSPTTATPMSVPPESPAKDISSPISNGIINGTSSTLPANKSALNIVGDLLRKVSALETKLASCRNIVREPNLTGTNTTPPHLRRSSLLSSPQTPRGLKRTMNATPNGDEQVPPARSGTGVVKISV